LEYAKNLIKSKAGKNASRRDSATDGADDADGDDGDDDEEESWTFVGTGGSSEPDPVVDEFAVPGLGIDGLGAAGKSVSRSRTPEIFGGARALGSRVLGRGG